MVRPKGLSAAAETTAPHGSSPVALIELFQLAAPAGIVAPDVLALRLELLRRSFRYWRPELDDHVFTVEVEFETSFDASSRRNPGPTPLPRETSRRRLHNGPRDRHWCPALSRFGGKATAISRTVAAGRQMLARQGRLKATNVQILEERGLVTLGETNTLTLMVVVKQRKLRSDPTPTRKGPIGGRQRRRGEPRRLSFARATRHDRRRFAIDQSRGQEIVYGSFRKHRPPPARAAARYSPLLTIQPLEA
jgi:hypothetical protein